MKLKTMLLLVLIVSMCAVAQVSGESKAKLSVLETIELDGKPLDVVLSYQDNKIFVLTKERELLMYGLDGKLAQRVALDEKFTSLEIDHRNQKIILTNAKEKKVKLVQISLFKDINIEGAPARGPEDAKINIVIFSDFECPWCSKLKPTIKEVEDAYKDKVKVVFKNFPLRSHRNAIFAAEAALAAGKQGKFWEFHDILFENSNALDKEKIKGFADTLQLDRAKFDADLEDPKIKARVKEDTDHALALGIRAVPSVFINGFEVKGKTLENFKQIIDEELKKK